VKVVSKNVRDLYITSCIFILVNMASKNRRKYIGVFTTHLSEDIQPLFGHESAKSGDRAQPQRAKDSTDP